MPTINGRSITKTQLREMLKAVRDLKRKYENKEQLSKYTGEHPFSFDCPLCNFAEAMGARYHYPPIAECFCPWYFFESTHCVSGGYAVETTKKRLARCDRWINRILEELVK